MPDKEKDEPQVRSFAVEGNKLSGYTGVDPEYQTYANKTDAPLVARNEFKMDNPPSEAAVVKQPSHPQMDVISESATPVHPTEVNESQNAVAASEDEENKEETVPEAPAPEAPVPSAP